MADIKIGIFGAWRGNSYIELMAEEPDIEIVAICDKNIESLENKDELLKNAACFTDFDEFISYGKSVGMNCVFLLNYFHQHAPFAIKAMNEGLDVFSECTAASTLRECVELVETVERTGRKYLLCENYPFAGDLLRMKSIVDSGKLGTLLYAEGEYNHSGDNEELRRLTPGPYHWRAWMPRTYYITHALGPVMYMSQSAVRYVSARAAHSDLLYKIKDWRHNYDGVGMMFCEMDNGMIARVTGCTAMASDYSRYRVCGDISSVECGGYVPDDQVRHFYFDHLKPEGSESNVFMYSDDISDLVEDAEKAEKAGHGGGDYWVVREIIDMMKNGKQPFFDVYRAVNMSATAILGWRSSLNHGENYLVPDFRDPAQREKYRDDDLTPFPDENGEGATLPPALPYND